METNGSNDAWDLCVPAVFGPPSYGLIIGPHARDNLFLVKDLQGGFYDGSGGRSRFV